MYIYKNNVDYKYSSYTVASFVHTEHRNPRQNYLWVLNWSMLDNEVLGEQLVSGRAKNETRCLSSVRSTDSYLWKTIIWHSLGAKK